MLLTTLTLAASFTPSTCQTTYRYFKDLYSRRLHVRYNDIVDWDGSYTMRWYSVSNHALISINFHPPESILKREGVLLGHCASEYGGSVEVTFEYTPLTDWETDAT